jgi:hypothetical protein
MYPPHHHMSNTLERKDFSFCYDALNGVQGPYAKKVLIHSFSKVLSSNTLSKVLSSHRFSKVDSYSASL